jgi:hypothetical protein
MTSDLVTPNQYGSFTSYDQFLFCFGFYVTSTQYRSYRDVPALLVEEDLPFRALFQARTSTWVEPPTFRKLAG